MSSTVGVQSRWLLVTGAPRSGTTLIKSLLNLNPHVFVCHEVRAADVLLQIAALQALLAPDTAPIEHTKSEAGDEQALAPTQLFYKAREKNESPAHDGFSRHPDLSLAVWRALSGKKDLRILGNKLPACEATFSDIHRFNDESCPRVIFVVRNPLDVINSSLRRRLATRNGLDNWHIQDVADACMEWRRAWLYLIQLLEQQPSNILIVAYRDLCENASEVMTQVFDFLQEDHVEIDYPVVELPGDLRLTFFSPPELAYTKTYLQDFLHLSDAQSIRVALQRTPRFTPPLAIDEIVSFGSTASEHFCQWGFHEIEPWGRWTGPRANLAFSLGPEQVSVFAEIKIKSAFDDDRALCSYSVNGGRRILFDAAKSNLLLVDLGEAEDRNSGIVEIEILTSDTKKPWQKASGDNRPLGIALESFQLRSVIFEPSSQDISHFARNPS